MSSGDELNCCGAAPLTANSFRAWQAAVCTAPLFGWCCIAVTTVLWILWFHESGYGANKGFTVLGMQPMAPLTIASALALIIGSLVSRAPEERQINKFFPNKAR